MSRAVGSGVMNDIVLGGGIAGGRAGEVGVFVYSGKVGTIRDGGKGG